MSKAMIMVCFMLLLGMGTAIAQNVAAPARTIVSNPNDTTEWKINLLKEPNSPGASILDISPSAIQRPSDPTALTVSLLNSTDNLTTIPNSYAVDFAPQWLFWGKNVTHSDFLNNDNIWNNIKQTFDISLAMHNLKDNTTNVVNTKLGVGFKASIKRGNISKITTDAMASVHTYQSNYLALRKTYVNDAVKQAKASGMDANQRNLLIAAADQKAQTDARNLALQDSIKKVAQGLDFTREGFMLDVAEGLAYNFVSQANGTLYNSGAWITAGQQWADGIELLGIVRYLYNPENTGSILSSTNYHTIDAGARVLYDPQNNKFSFGLEGIYRNVSGTTAIKSSYRYALTADYRIGNNQALSFNIGRDFDGTVNKGGNLIAALNFLIGFGSTRPVSGAK